MMQHLGEVPFHQVLETTSPSELFHAGERSYQVNTQSARLNCFRNSLVCAACGLEGTKFILCQNPGDSRPHLNLYASEEGTLVLMTKDHIVPVSRGGSEKMSNFRTMCAPCNHVRGNNQALSLEDIRTRRLSPGSPKPSKKAMPPTPVDFEMPTHFLGSPLTEVYPNYFKSACKRYHIHLDVDTHEFFLEYRSQGGGADLFLWDLVDSDFKALEARCLRQMKAHFTDLSDALSVKRACNRKQEKVKQRTPEKETTL